MGNGRGNADSIWKTENGEEKTGQTRKAEELSAIDDANTPCMGGMASSSGEAKGETGMRLDAVAVVWLR